MEKDSTFEIMQDDSRFLNSRVAIQSRFEGTLSNYSRPVYSSGKDRLMDLYDNRFYEIAKAHVEEPS